MGTDWLDYHHRSGSGRASLLAHDPTSHARSNTFSGRTRMSFARDFEYPCTWPMRESSACPLQQFPMRLKSHTETRHHNGCHTKHLMCTHEIVLREVQRDRCMMLPSVAKNQAYARVGVGSCASRAFGRTNCETPLVTAPFPFPILNTESLQAPGVRRLPHLSTSKGNPLVNCRKCFVLTSSVIGVSRLGN